MADPYYEKRRTQARKMGLAHVFNPNYCNICGGRLSSKQFRPQKCTKCGASPFDPEPRTASQVKAERVYLAMAANDLETDDE